MLRAVEGQMIVEPASWTVVFDRAADRWWLDLVPGRYKHVRAYAYAPFLHVWVFVDPRLDGLRVQIAADGEPAAALAASWAVNSDRIRMPRGPDRIGLPVFGWCVPVIKRLLGIRSRALRPDALYRYCLEHGGEPFEVFSEHSKAAASPA